MKVLPRHLQATLLVIFIPIGKLVCMARKREEFALLGKIMANDGEHGYHMTSKLLLASG